MGGVRPLLAPLSAAPLLAWAGISLAGCAEEAPAAQAPTSTPIPTVQVTLLVHVSPDDERWFRDVDVPRGANAYELTELVTEGEIEATYYPVYKAHFINALLGVKNKDSNYWLVYLWDEPNSAWEPMPVGAERFSLKEGDVLAWAYADTNDKGYHEKLTEPPSPRNP